MDSANQKDLWDKVDATWQLSRRAVRSLTSLRAPGFSPRRASAVKQLASLLPKFPVAIPSLRVLGGHAIDRRPSSKFQMFTILENAVTTEDYNIIGPLGEVKPSPEDNNLTGDDSLVMSSVESLTPRAAREGDSFQGYRPLDAFELPGEFNPDTDIDTNFSHEAASETPATPVASPPPSTPTVSAAATARASQLPLFPESAPDIAGLTQTLAATDSPTPLGTGSPATVNSDLSEKCLKLEQLIFDL